MRSPWRAIRRRRDEKRRDLRLEYEARTGRHRYYVGTDHAALSDVRLIWHHVLEVLRPVLGGATVDLYSDRRNELPPEAEDGLAFLIKAEGRQRMGSWVDLADPAGFTAVQSFGIEAIACNAYLATDVRKGHPVFGSHVVYNHDGGWSVVLELTDQEHADLVQRLESVGIAEGVLIAWRP